MEYNKRDTDLNNDGNTSDEELGLVRASLSDDKGRAGVGNALKFAIPPIVVEPTA